MTIRFMLDTNIVSDLMRRADGKVTEKLRRIGPGSGCVSIVTAAELRFGARKRISERLRVQIENVLKLLPPLAFERPADVTYADIRADLETAGTPIGPHDLLIAAHALTLDLTLVTANIREFSRVPNLRVENWLD